MGEKTRVITIENINHCQVEGGEWGGIPTLTVHGRSPGGQFVRVVLHVPLGMLGYIGKDVHKALDNIQSSLATSRSQAKGERQ